MQERRDFLLHVKCGGGEKIHFQTGEEEDCGCEIPLPSHAVVPKQASKPYFPIKRTLNQFDWRNVLYCVHTASEEWEAFFYCKRKRDYVCTATSSIHSRPEKCFCQILRGGKKEFIFIHASKKKGSWLFLSIHNILVRLTVLYTLSFPLFFAHIS